MHRLLMYQLASKNLCISVMSQLAHNKQQVAEWWGMGAMGATCGLGERVVTALCT